MDEEPKDEKYKINGPVSLSLHIQGNGDALELRKGLVTFNYQLDATWGRVFRRAYLDQAGL